MTRISYGMSSFAWSNVITLIEQLILDRGFKRIVEIGGGANPTFSLQFVERHNLEYTLLDISQAELDKAPSGYRKVCADICAEELAHRSGGYDFAFSRMLAEHVSSGERFHRNVHALLRNHGMAFHFFPTLFAAPFVANLLLPERYSERILHLLQPGRERDGKLGKFPAYYKWCRGPLRSQIQKFMTIGFDVAEYAGFFGHESYYQKIPGVRHLHVALSRILSKYPMPALTSFAHVLLIKREKHGSA